MAKRLIRKKPKSDPDDVLVVGDPEQEEDTTYWPVIGTDYHIGYDDVLKHFVYDPEGETGWEPLAGWKWYSDRKTMLRNLHRFLNNEAPLPTFTTKSDPVVKGMRLVKRDDAPRHPRFPVLAEDLGLPATKTYFRWNPKEKAVVAIVSVDANGLHLGWDQCGGCSSTLLRCRCPQGVKPPRGIVWCCTGAATDWTEKPNYTEATHSPGRSPTSGRSKTPSRYDNAVSAPVRPVTPERGSKASTGILADLDKGVLDLGAVTKAAEASATASAKSVRRIIKKKRKA